MNLSESLRNQSFEKIKNSLADRQWEVFILVANHSNGLSAWQVATLLKRPVYVVRPRLTELRDMGLLQVTDVTYYPGTQRRESIWCYRAPAVSFSVDVKEQPKFL